MRDISKLPKWAQSEIAVLRGRVAHYEQTEAAIEAGTTNTMVLPPMWPLPGNDPVYLADGTDIRFLIPGGRVECNVASDGELRIYGNASHGGTFSVTPSASNAIRLRFIPRDAS